MVPENSTAISGVIGVDFPCFHRLGGDRRVEWLEWGRKGDVGVALALLG